MVKIAFAIFAMQSGEREASSTLREFRFDTPDTFAYKVVPIL